MAATIGNPIISTTTTGLMGLKRPLKVTKVYWDNPAAATNTIQITDGAGNVLVQATAQAASVPISLDFVVPKIFPSNPQYAGNTGSDWKINAITGGTLYIYYR